MRARRFVAIMLALGCAGLLRSQGPGGVASGRDRNEMESSQTTTGEPACLPRPILPSPSHVAEAPECGDHERLEVTDSSGAMRWGCFVTPSGAGAGTPPLPLMIYLHPTSPRVAFDALTTPFARSRSTADLSGGGPRGYYMLVPQAQLIDTKGLGIKYAWDASDRDANTNLDLSALDALLAAVLSRGHIDSHRIYLTGWSSGAFFAALYGFLRPGVAAAAVYGGAQMWDENGYVEVPSGCPGPLAVACRTPFLGVYRSCDAIVPCAWTDAFLSTLGPGWPSRKTMINDWGWDAWWCDPSCGPLRGGWNHVNWPREREPQMLEWLRSHPLP